MRFIYLVALVAAGCGSRPNPNFKCCTTEEDCAANNISTITPCDSGYLCRGNKCVVEQCDNAAACDPTAPYCIGAPDGSCQEQCAADEDCPGFGQSSAAHLCERGACVECRGNNECAADEPICSDGACRKCIAHSECTSGFCGSQGTCVAETDIAFVSANGSPSSDCNKTNPCSLPRAVEAVPMRVYIMLAPGMYQLTQELALIGERWLLGTGPTLPMISRTTAGSIIRVNSASDVTLDHLEIRGATTSGPNYGYGVESSSAGGAITRLIDVVLTFNAAAGYYTQSGTLIARRTRFSNNGIAARVTDGTLDVDACVINDNTTGIEFDSGQLRITNSFVYRNRGGLAALFLYETQPLKSQVEFNTIVDNDTGLSCTGAMVDYRNNIVARNTTNVTGGSCTTSGSIVLGSDIGTVKFRSPDSQPYDYHLLPGSAAIDAAMGMSMLATDFDGDPRPAGTARDVGADEVQ